MCRKRASQPYTKASTCFFHFGMFLFFPNVDVFSTVHKLIKSNINFLCISYSVCVCFDGVSMDRLREFINVIQHAAWRRLLSACRFGVKSLRRTESKEKCCGRRRVGKEKNRTCDKFHVPQVCILMKNAAF
ncbi:CLUMA_CG015938, isoform A [Clunio marinus]|uniref:CLUMA_CG015938, isoform A n=1 Tax=Clunio marinus TaxID=568069 RepID=A0A1J1IRD0_9DIPT|nr:CLUMA_CG015938, isoform A [Clunio marinus]